MRLDERDRALLLDMLKFARGAVKALEGATFEQFQVDENLRLATERRIEIIGEAARSVSDQCRTSSPEIPWRKVIAQRHVLAHDYGLVRHDIVWRVVIKHLPTLIGALEALLGSPPASP